MYFTIHDEATRCNKTTHRKEEKKTIKSKQQRFKLIDIQFQLHRLMW